MNGQLPPAAKRRRAQPSPDRLDTTRSADTPQAALQAGPSEAALDFIRRVQSAQQRFDVVADDVQKGIDRLKASITRGRK